MSPVTAAKSVLRTAMKRLSKMLMEGRKLYSIVFAADNIAQKKYIVCNSKR